MKIKEVSGFLNALATNKGHYFLTVEDLNNMYSADSPYDPKDLSNMIFNYLLGFAIDKERYPNCAQMIHSSDTVTLDTLQNAAELLELIPLTSHPSDGFVHWLAADLILAYMLDLEALQIKGDPEPRYAVDFFASIDHHADAKSVVTTSL